MRYEVWIRSINPYNPTIQNVYIHTYIHTYNVTYTHTFVGLSRDVVIIEGWPSVIGGVIEGHCNNSGGSLCVRGLTTTRGIYSYCLLHVKIYIYL